MRLASITFVILISLISCDFTDSPTPSIGYSTAEKLVFHGYRKYTYKQFGSAHKAYLEAFFAYKDAHINPIPKLYIGFSALIIQQLHDTPTYPIVGRTFIIDNEKQLTIRNNMELLKASLQYLLAAQALGTNDYKIDNNAINDIILCHESHLSGKQHICNLVDESLFSYKLK